MADSRKVVLIDLSSLFWTAWHSSGADAVSAARDRTLAAVQRCVGGADALVAICCDSGRSFRKDLAPQYKANRPEKDHASIAELDGVKSRLRADGYLLWEAPGFEADDVIATATVDAESAGHDVLICTADKDILQLIGERVRCLRTHVWQEVGAAEVTAKFGVEPYQLGDWLALVGDKSDNVAGCPGVGPVKATELLKKWSNLAGVWGALAIDETKVATPAIVKALKANREAVELARKLVALRIDAPVTFAEIYESRTAQPISGKSEDEDMDEPEPEFTDVPISNGPGPQAPPPPAAPPAPAPEVQPTSSAASTVALVPRTYETELEPTSIGTAFRLAKGLYDSRLYSRFPNPEAIMAVIIRGREMGLGALTSLDSFHVIEGKPAPHAYLIIARAKADPDCEYFQCVETTPDRCTWETKSRRNPKPTRITYTLAQATAAGLVKPGGNWTKRPDEMLRKTAGVQLARVEYPEAAMGLYAIEEMEAAA